MLTTIGLAVISGRVARFSLVKGFIEGNEAVGLDLLLAYGPAGTKANPSWEQVA